MSRFTSTRTIAATPSAIFAAMANPDRLAIWWGPDGFTNQFAVCEFTPGGRWVFTMIGPDGATYPNESVFDAIDPDRRLVIRHVCPPEFTLTITLEPTAGGTAILWEQVFADAQVAEAVRHIVAPANEQNLDRLTAEVLRGGTPTA